MRLITRIISDVHHVLDLEGPETPHDSMINLWDPDGDVPSGINYSTSDDLDW